MLMQSKEPDTQKLPPQSVSGGPSARLIAFYLPQFHPIAENDRWWGKGFTEWTNVAQARPLFRGHYQPHIPADLGFYDLRLAEVRAAQACLARSAGIEGFCYWHYWFAGKRLLERPFNEVLRSGEPGFPFCLGWANQAWTGIWHGAPNKTLMEQTYPGPADWAAHFFALLEAFHDRRYIRVRGKPLFLVYRPTELPDTPKLIECWQKLAIGNGLPGIHFVAHVLSPDQPYDYLAQGYSGAVATDVFRVSNLRIWCRAVAYYRRRDVSRPLLWARAFVRAVGLKVQKHLRPYLSRPTVIDYAEAMEHFLDNVSDEPHSYPCVVPNWDNSPRSGPRAVVLQGSTPEMFREHLRQALDRVAARDFEDRIVFVKSWNEWAEGNYLEPDQRFGRQYLDVLAEETLAKSRAEICAK
jgi:hypothetical protein